MQLASLPAKIARIWANAAGSSYTRAIPSASQQQITPGAASFDDGFPPLCFLPTTSGGVPPAGQDFNGLLNQITAWNRWQAAGGTVPFDSTFAAAISGYPLGAVLQSTTPGLLWLNIVDGNSNNPDASGSGWLPILTGASFAGLSPGRLLNVQSFNGAGTFTYTPTSGTKFIRVRVLGAGGAGGGAVATSGSNMSVGAPGGAGAYAIARIYSNFSGVTVTVGAAGVPASGTTGGNGGTSAFGSLVISPGGVGGGIAQPAGAGIGVGGQQSPAPTISGSVTTEVSATGAPGGTSFGINANNGAYGADGGVGPYGGGGPSINSNVNGVAANSPGAGGGGSATTNGFTSNLLGGAGGVGKVDIEEYVS